MVVVRGHYRGIPHGGAGGGPPRAAAPRIVPAMSGLLIVNADDFGGNPLATARIVECFAANRITSTTAMVYMQDSANAAQIARDAGDVRLAVGLHLNLTQAFDDPSTPAAIRERQAQAVRYFAGRRAARFTFNPALMRLVERCVNDQLDGFRTLYGREPTHIDGHNHVHMSPTVLLALPRATPVRTGESGLAGAGSGGSAAEHVRRARHRFIAHRHLTTARFYAINRLGDRPTASDMHALLAAAGRHSVEIMTHPDRDGDYRLLMSDQWREALAEHRLGSFADLRESPARRRG